MHRYREYWDKGSSVLISQPFFPPKYVAMVVPISRHGMGNKQDTLATRERDSHFKINNV